MKIGDYVRTEYGISRYKRIIPNAPVIQTDRGITSEDEIIKSSPNIIDLIQVGDYVNGKEIEQIIDNELYFETSDMASIISFKEKDIKSIVTKEQFEIMEYKVRNKIWNKHILK